MRYRPQINTAIRAPNEVPAMIFARGGASDPACIAFTSRNAVERQNRPDGQAATGAPDPLAHGLDHRRGNLGFTGMLRRTHPQDVALLINRHLQTPAVRAQSIALRRG